MWLRRLNGEGAETLVVSDKICGAGYMRRMPSVPPGSGESTRRGRTSKNCTAEDVDKDLLLAAVEAAPYIRPREATMMLIEWADCDDEDIAEAVEEAMVMTEFASGLGEGSFGDEDVRL